MELFQQRRTGEVVPELLRQIQDGRGEVRHKRRETSLEKAIGDMRKAGTPEIPSLVFPSVAQGRNQISEIGGGRALSAFSGQLPNKHRKHAFDFEGMLKAGQFSISVSSTPLGYIRWH